jgi:hypothetical protein
VGVKEQSGRTWPSIFWAHGTVSKNPRNILECSEQVYWTKSGKNIVVSLVTKNNAVFFFKLYIAYSSVILTKLPSKLDLSHVMPSTDLPFVSLCKTKNIF